ncbi:MAG: DinB family protein [Rhodothermales bacterium]
MAPLPSMLEHILLRDLKTLRDDVEAYPDEDAIWAQPPGLPNSGGTLVLHLAGNIQHFIGARLGGSDFIRDRTAEFGLRNVPRAELLAAVDAATAAVRATFPRLSGADLGLPFPDMLRDRVVETGDMLLHLAVHLGYHLGQVDYHRRVVTGDSKSVGALPATGLFTARLA